MASRIDRFGGWMLGAYGGIALGALAYDMGEDVGHALGEGLAVGLVCGGLGVDPDNCVLGMNRRNPRRDFGLRCSRDIFTDDEIDILERYGG